MQDAKTGGSRWVPDIREDEITEFQEQNGDETATYKAVNVHPIISRILDKLAFFRTHVSAVWYNKLANKTVKDKLDEIDTSISSLNSNSELKSLSGTKMNVFYNAQIVILHFNTGTISAGSNTICESIKLPDGMYANSDRFCNIPILSSSWYPTDNIANLTFSLNMSSPKIRFKSGTAEMENIVLVGSYVFPRDYFYISAQ